MYVIMKQMVPGSWKYGPKWSGKWSGKDWSRGSSIPIAYVQQYLTFTQGKFFIGHHNTADQS